MKKAQAAQFNWIFIMVAGAIILTFFIIFSIKFIDLQNKKTEFHIARNFDINIESLKTSTEEMYCDTEISDNCVSLGFQTNVNLECNNNQLNIILNNNIIHSLKDQTLFSPKKFKTKNMNFWIKKLKYPYYITNLIYLQPQNHKIYIKGDDVDIPLIFNVEKLTTINNIEKNSKVSFINIIPTQEEINYLKTNKIPYNIINNNKVQFEDEEIEINEELIMAAIFSDNKEIFKCNLKQIEQQHYKITQLYYNKANILKSENCNYNLIQNTLTQFTEPKEEIKELLIKQNQELLSQNCPVLF